MLTIIDDPVGTNDIQYPRCTGFLYEYQYGFEVHTNCHDILAEAIREYGLTPDDVHDSFNFWMHTGVADDHMYIKRLLARKGDYVELIAQMDVLAVPNVCGADIFSTSNFELKPLLVQVYEGTEEQHERWLEPAGRRYVNQRTVDDFKVKQIRVERELDPRRGLPRRSSPRTRSSPTGSRWSSTTGRPRGGRGATGQLRRH